MSFLRKLATCMIFVGLLLVAAGCGQGSKPPAENKQGNQAVQPEKAAKKEEALPKVLALANNPNGTLINTLGTGIATELTKTLGIQVKSSALNGPQEWLPLLGSGEMDMGILNNYDAAQGWLGKGTYAPISQNKGFPISLLTSGHKSIIGIIVANNSDIKTGSDLKGRKFAGIISGTPGITLQNNALLANYGLTPDDVKNVTMPNINAAVQAVTTGQVEGTSVSVGTPAVSELDASSKGARFLSLDPSPEAVKKMTGIFPGKVVKVSPGKANVGIRQDTNLLQYEFYLVGRNALSETTVYNIIKSLWDNNQELTAINNNLSDWTRENFVVENFTIPYHPGAIKFYKEQGLWTADMEKRQQELLASKK